MTPLPDGPDDLTPAWLTKVLRISGHLPGGKVGAVSVEVIGTDRGFTGVIARLRLRYEGIDDGDRVRLLAAGHLPASLVAKFPAATGVHYERCAREVRFYCELARAGDPVPRLYHAAADPDRQRVVLLLADLADGRLGDALTGCTPAEAGAVIDAIAPLHARMWGRPVPGWLPPLVTDPAAGQQRYASRVGPFLDRYGHRLSAAGYALIERSARGHADTLTELMAAPATVLHADLHLDNVVFDFAGEPVMLLDWQSACRGPASVDLTDLLCGSLAAGERRGAQTELRERYLARLTESGVDGYSMPQVRRDSEAARRRYLAGLVGWLAAADPEALGDRQRALVARAFDTICALVDG